MDGNSLIPHFLSMGLSALGEKGKAVVVVFTESKGMRFGLGKLLLVIKDLRSAKGASLRRGGWHPFPLEPHTCTQALATP